MPEESRILWFGNLPEHLDPARDRVFSAVTLARREADFVAYAEQGLLAPAQFHTDDMIVAESAVQQAYRVIALPHLARLLKGQGCPAFSSTSLSVLGGAWLIFLLQICWLNYRTLERHMATLGASSIVAIAPEGPPFVAPPRNSQELVALMCASEFHAWVASRFLLALKPDGWTISDYAPAKLDLTRGLNRAPLAWRVRLRAGLRKLLTSGRCTTEQLPLPWRLLFGVMLALRKTNLAAGGANYQIDHPSGVPLPAPFLATLGCILDECTPLFFRKDFVRRVEKVRQEARFRPGFARIVGSNIYDDDANLKKALACEAGEVVLSVQHGGGYGTHRVFPLSPESEYLGGPFISWGWTRHNKYSVRALDLPSPALSRLAVARKRARRGSHIIFVGGDMNPGVLRVHSKPSGFQWLDYRQQKVDFLDALSNGARGNVVYRGYYTGTLSDEDFLRGKHPDLRICGGSSKIFHRSLLSASACVVDHPITTFHQTLAMNLPTIAYWNPDHWAFCADAVPLFEELEHAGILYRSGREAGCFLNANVDRLSTWWENDAVQSARRHWCHHYARTSPHWAREWISALWDPQG